MNFQAKDISNVVYATFHKLCYQYFSSFKYILLSNELYLHYLYPFSKMSSRLQQAFSNPLSKI